MAAPVSVNIGPHGTRLDREHILVPLFDAGGALTSLQSIDPSGHKLFEAELPVAGSMFVIGGPLASGAGPAIICEGFATGASLHEATGRPVVVTFNAGNLVKVAERLVPAFPAVRWQVAGDDDKNKPTNVGRDAGLQAARILRCDAVFPMFPEGSDGTDFNDMAADYGAQTKTMADPSDHAARFALIIEIDAGETSSELYAEVQEAIRLQSSVELLV